MAFAMTVDKSQGQTLDRVGVFLLEECFAHGQLYVTLSRVGDPLQLIVVLPRGRTSTKSVVYQELSVII
jgi:ATP-dependent exoDNAse (exonuclease V) alpha subunit